MIQAAIIGGVFVLIAAGINLLKKSPSKRSTTTDGSFPSIVTTGPESPVYNIMGNVTIHNHSEISTEVAQNITEQDVGKGDELILRVRDSFGNMTRIKPVEGKIYTSYSPKGAKLEYMLKDGKIHVDYTSPDGKTKSYYVSDSKGNVVDYKFPYMLQEYTVIIPQDLELRRHEQIMPNGWKLIRVDLKWNGAVDMLLNNDNKLQQVSIKGGARVSHKRKTITVGHTSKTKK
jgi:hypothetical protein